MKKLHLICNAHIDPCWQWDLDEGIGCALSTFRCAADFCDEYDALVFNHNEALLYQYVEAYEPELFKRIQKLVSAGKWHIMGGWYLQPDCNLPSGESFIRQILSGRKYFYEKFGICPTTAINVDSFGHTRGLVQIMKKSGFDSYIFCRPFEKDMHLENDDFIWEGYDGSKIQCFRTYGIYNSLYGTAAAKIEEWLDKFKYKSLGCVLWGVGDHGGGPSRVDLDQIKALQTKYENRIQIIHSTPEAYFKDAKKSQKDLPIWNKGLNHWGAGCYSSMVKIKQVHRHFESEFFLTEKMASHAALTESMPYPSAKLKDALEALMFAQFHDILPGSAIEKVETTGLRKMNYGLEILSHIKSKCFFILCKGQKKAADNEIPIMIYNPHPYVIEGTFECEFMLANMNVSGTFMNPVVYKNGIRLPSQCEKEDSNFPMDWRKKVVFYASLQPGQINRFDCLLEELDSEISLSGINIQSLADSFLKPDSCSKFSADRIFRMPFGKPEFKISQKNDNYCFFGKYFTVYIDSQTGFINYLAYNDKQILCSNAVEPLIMKDSVDSWAANQSSFKEIIGRFKLASPEYAGKMAGVQGSLPPVRVIEDGEVESVIECSLYYETSQLLLTYRLPKNDNKIEVSIKVNWNEKDSMIKVALPTVFADDTCTLQTSCGSEKCISNGQELYMQQWCGYFNNDIAFGIINDGIYGFSSKNSTLYLTLMRSPAYAAHPSPAPNILSPLDYMSVPRMDQGFREFKFWIIAGETKALKSSIDREALALNEKPYALSFFPESCGDKPEPLYYFTKKTSAIVTAFKLSESGECYILRIFEPLDIQETAEIHIPLLNIRHKIILNPYEIVTFKCTCNHIIECSLMEDEYEISTT